MSQPQGDGKTAREHYQAAERQTGNRPPQLDGPDCPDLFSHVWAWFAELNEARGSGGFGPNPISYAEIDAWARRTGRSPLPFEVELLRAIDAIFMQSRSAKAGKP